jgi:2-oxoglutarate dehydrogenase E1 component
MNRSTVANRENLELIEANHQRWLNDPGSVDASWQSFFQGYELARAAAGLGESSAGSDDSQAAQAAVSNLINAYREMGHYLADLDPLGLSARTDSHGMLELSRFGLTEKDLDRTFYTKLVDTSYTTLRNLIEVLNKTYCGTIGVEYMHIRNPIVRTWLQDRMEPIRNDPNPSREQKLQILKQLSAAESFESFLQIKYQGQKRFSNEGGESLIPLLDTLVDGSSKYEIRDIVIGMPHRGRLAVLAHTMKKPLSVIFTEFEDKGGERSVDDVKYHLGYSGTFPTSSGHQVNISLTPNPSHLEAVNPVVEGRVRAKQRRYPNQNKKLGLPILLHGDAAFAGQGLVAETLNLSQLDGYGTGGTIHVVVNNQVGFTTNPSDARSTRYCTDVAKMLEVPIFHVNGDDPEAVCYVAGLALDFREAFGQDVVIDLVCYRKQGHNETDEPAYTQPKMYQEIRRRPSVLTKYIVGVVASGEISPAEIESIRTLFVDEMETALFQARSGQDLTTVHTGFKGRWHGFTQEYSFAPVNTAVPYETLEAIAKSIGSLPPGFQMDPKLRTIIEGRYKAVATDKKVNWALAEALAFGSLLLEGIPVRLSGQDCRRGTFSQRHASIVDAATEERYMSLNHMTPDQATICVHDSLLSEAAVLGFDYGYSLDEPNMLILWEAQFGDFVNGAQVLIDQFIASGESKWGRSSGLVMLLPHGYEGNGPEHSSARLERFLQLCAEDNLQVVYPSTPAQYFHVLRRQIKRNFRKPLVVMTPKWMLRYGPASSPIEELSGGAFQEVLDSPGNPAKPSRVILCSGKVYYNLLTSIEKEKGPRDVAIVRVEQFYPWPEEMLKKVLARYAASAEEWVWVQEEPQNMGAWSFLEPRLQKLIDGVSFEYVGRCASASPSTGSHHIHDHEQEELVEAALRRDVPHLV